MCDTIFSPDSCVTNAFLYCFVNIVRFHSPDFIDLGELVTLGQFGRETEVGLLDQNMDRCSMEER